MWFVAVIAAVAALVAGFVLGQREKNSKGIDPVQAGVDSATSMLTAKVVEALHEDLALLTDVDDLQRQTVALKQQVAELEATKARVAEDFARKEREIEHKVGLLRTQMEAERKAQEGDFTLRVREVQLAAKEAGVAEREKAFQERMDFIQKRFETEVGYLKELLEGMQERLPSAAILARIGNAEQLRSESK